MKRIIFRRVLRAIPILVIVTFAISVMVNLLPGNAAVAILGTSATPARIATLSRELGLNQSVFSRYFHWLWHALQGNFGTDILSGQPISTEIGDGYPVTLEIVLLAELIAVVIAVPIALYVANRMEGLVDRISRAIMSVLLSVPTFIAGPLLALLFAETIRAFPVSGWTPLSGGIISNLHTAFLPALALGLPQAAVFNRVLRSDLTSLMHQDFIMFARSKGLSRSYVVMRHALRPASTSFVTVLGLSIGALLGGALIVETLFSLPGLGQVIVQGVYSRDLGVVQAGVLVIGLSYVVLNTLVDIAYGLLDPRVRAQGAATR